MSLQALMVVSLTSASTAKPTSRIVTPLRAPSPLHPQAHQAHQAHQAAPLRVPPRAPAVEPAAQQGFKLAKGTARVLSGVFVALGWGLLILALFWCVDKVGFDDFMRSLGLAQV